MTSKMLSEITSVITKGTTPTSVGCSFSKNGINYIKSESITSSRTLDKSKYAFISEETHQKLKRSQIKENDILFSMAGMFLGKTGIVQADDVPANTNQAVAIIRIVPEQANYLYVYYYLNQKNIVTWINSLSGQSAQPNINLKQIGEIEIPLPDRIIQDTIVEMLSAIDSRIELNTAINENLHQLIAAYYAEIFKECEHTAKISDYADRVFSGGTPTTSNESYWSGEFKWLSSGETSQKYIVDTEKTITQAGVDNSSTRLAKKYDTVIASAGQGHTRGQTSMLLTDTYINQSIIVVESERIYMPFIYWNICGRYEELRVISNSNSIRGSLTTKMISAFTSPKADITQISRFSELAWAAIHEIEKNCNEIARLAALRDTLLPKLMNGEIDVSAVKI